VQVKHEAMEAVATQENHEPTAPGQPGTAGKTKRKLAWGGAGVAVAAVATGLTLAFTGGGATPATQASDTRQASSSARATKAAEEAQAALAARNAAARKRAEAVKLPSGPSASLLGSLSTLGPLKAPPPAGPDGFEGVPVPNAAPLVSTATIATGQTVDGISCQPHLHLLYHLHAHLAIFVDGTQRQIPAGVGIPGAKYTKNSKGQAYINEGTCFYWLHTHAADGVIHIETPEEFNFTLGDFFDEWGQSLNSDQVGPDKGHVTAFYDGKVYQGNPRDIPLTSEAQIQLDVGSPLVAPQTITFPKNLNAYIPGLRPTG